jgi:hypothetical protein
MVTMGDMAGFRRGLDARGLWCGEERKWCFVGVILPFSPRRSLEGWIGESRFTGAVFGGIDKSIVNKISQQRPQLQLQLQLQGSSGKCSKVIGGHR